MDAMRTRGRILVGTSGFAYPDWMPRFYPPGTRSTGLLPHYASRLPAVELNNTFYQQPTPDRIASWLAATPPGFRFAVKAQRGGAWRALRSPDPRETTGWLTAPYRDFGDRLGTVLLRVDAAMKVDLPALERLLAAWPGDIPIAFEFLHPTWDLDEVHALLRTRGAALVATDQDDGQEPVLRRVGPCLYLRLRRTVITDEALARWADRIRPFLDDGLDAYVFLRHDDDGSNALRAERLEWTLSNESPPQPPRPPEGAS